MTVPVDTRPADAERTIRAAAPGFAPRVAILAGSGLAEMAAAIEPIADLPYDAIPGFPTVAVAGHQGALRLGRLGPVPVALLQGRAHGYEGDPAAMAVPIRTLRRLGCRAIVLTAAVGALSDALPPGRLVLIVDHINLTGTGPLVGPNDPGVGPRFVALVPPYDPGLQQSLRSAATDLDLTLDDGVLAGMRGPQFETPAEARMLRTLGADIVGMSVVNECILAHHCGLSPAGLAVVVNGPPAAPGDAEAGAEAPDPHAETLRVARTAAPVMARLLTRAIAPQALTP